MTDDRNFNEGSDAIARQFADASAEVQRIAQDEIAPAADFIADAFKNAAQVIENELDRAARSGAFSLDKLGKALADNLRRNAIDSFVREPIRNTIASALGAPFSGARAVGGFVPPGASFLVGERGPELFTPASAGRVSALTGARTGGNGGVNVTIALPGVRDAESFRRSEAQISAALARAVGRGQRNL